MTAVPAGEAVREGRTTAKRAGRVGFQVNFVRDGRPLRWALDACGRCVEARPHLPAGVIATVTLIALGICAPGLRAEGGPDEVAVARLVAAIAEAGCRLTAENLDPVLRAAEIGAEDAALALARLADQGGARQGPDGAWLLAENLCPAGSD